MHTAFDARVGIAPVNVPRLELATTWRANYFTPNFLSVIILKEIT